MISTLDQLNALVVETNNSMRQILVSMLRSLGAKNIYVANTEIQTFEIINVEKVDLIVCGWSMPKLNALSILTKLRDAPETIKTPFIIISTIIEQDKIKQAVLNGVSEYIVPPFNKQIFETRIKKALKIPIRQSATGISQKLNAKRFTPKSKASQLSVLIVDDVPDNIEVLRGVIKDKYKIKAAINAKSAMKVCLSDTPPDLILLDIMMPEVDGLTLCKQLKDNPLTQNIAIIFVTALDKTEDVVKGLKLGAVDYIPKPIIPSIVLARLNVQAESIIAQRKTQAQVDRLIEINEQNAQFEKQINDEVSKAIENANSGIEQLEAKSSINKQLKFPISYVKSNTKKIEILLSIRTLFEAINAKTYQEKLMRFKISEAFENVLQGYQFDIEDKNLEIFDSIELSHSCFYGEKILTVLISCLLQVSLNAAPRGSKVSINSELFQEFCLLKFHNIKKFDDDIVEKLVNNEESIKETKELYLAFRISNLTSCDLYFLSDEKLGTTFYLKLPIKKATR